MTNRLTQLVNDNRAAEQAAEDMTGFPKLEPALFTGWADQVMVAIWEYERDADEPVTYEALLQQYPWLTDVLEQLPMLIETGRLRLSINPFFKGSDTERTKQRNHCAR